MLAGCTSAAPEATRSVDLDDYDDCFEFRSIEGRKNRLAGTVELRPDVDRSALEASLRRALDTRHGEGARLHALTSRDLVLRQRDVWAMDYAELTEQSLVLSAHGPQVFRERDAEIALLLSRVDAD